MGHGTHLVEGLGLVAFCENAARQASKGCSWRAILDPVGFLRKKQKTMVHIQASFVVENPYR
jgi:hypothetical protein